VNSSQAAPVIALEVSTMGDRAFTGIANVTKSIAREMLLDQSIEARFFMLRTEVPRTLVEQLVELDTGDILWWLSSRLRSQSTFDLSRPHIAIYPGPKRHRRLFPFEVQIVHDLTAIITPQFHTPETVKYHQSVMLGDMLSSDLLVAVSESTKVDIRTYFPQVNHIPCEVVGLASSVKAAPVGALDNKCVDYVLVLGTIEPRKNVKFVFQCLSEHRELFRRYKFVFVGRWGWGESAQKLFQTYDLLDEASSNAIVFTGFVSDAARDALMAYARVVVYPSRYEGFGLPVIEALSVGTPVITSYSSSLPEVGGDVTIYCDISSSQQLYQALEEVAIKHTMSENVEEEERHARIAWARSFSWNETFRKIKDAALELARVNNSRLD